jgi:hypothetical protein
MKYTQNPDEKIHVKFFLMPKEKDHCQASNGLRMKRLPSIDLCGGLFTS